MSSGVLQGCLNGSSTEKYQFLLQLRVQGHRSSDISQLFYQQFGHQPSPQHMDRLMKEHHSKKKKDRMIRRHILPALHPR